MHDIKIRFYTLSDVPALYTAVRESIPDVSKWLPWCHADYAIEESEAWLSDQIQKQKEGVEFAFAIVDSIGEYLGGCGLNQIDWDQKTANLGYWVRSSVAGHGVAGKAVELISKWAFENTELTRLEIKCAIGNKRSQRVAEKIGAVREGIRPNCLELHGKKLDAVIFSIQSGNNIF